MRTYDDITLISGTAHPELAKAIAAEVGRDLAKAHVARFPDGEVDIKIDEDLRGRDVFVLQPTCPPVNDNWVELLLLLDTLRRASAGRITAVMPYYGYARKDRKDEGRVPISAKVVANTLVSSGAERLVTLDMHAAQIQGFYDIPVDHLYARPVLLDAVAAVATERVAALRPHELIKFARNFAVAGHAAPVLLDALAAEASSRLDEFTPRELADVAWAFAKAAHAAPAQESGRSSKGGGGGGLRGLFRRRGGGPTSEQQQRAASDEAGAEGPAAEVAA